MTAAGESTSRLDVTARNMSGIVDTIKDIADQINLLALNATIEAARAGEAGRGFAVVASEVKNLAGQATEATGSITTEIQGLQTVAGAVVGSLGTIRSAIENVQDYVTATAAAVEEQSAVAREMSSNMQSASSAVELIATNITDIANATDLAHAKTSAVREALASISS